MSDEWFVTGINSGREVAVRAWCPGDGLGCSSAGYNSKHPCSEPVAVVKEVLIQPSSSSYRYERQTINRTLCLRHLAKHFDSDLGIKVENLIEKRAAEELAQRYWDQYQAIRARMSDEILQARFSMLPEALRDRVVALAKDSVVVGAE